MMLRKTVRIWASRGYQSPRFLSIAVQSIPKQAGAALAALGVCGLLVATTIVDTKAESPNKELIALSKKDFRDFTCTSTEALSSNTALIRFALPTEEHTLGLTVASCLSIKAEIDSKIVNRPYTPISTSEQKGHVDFVIKAYPPRTDGKPGGMGRYLCGLKVGDSIQMKGPWKKFEYKASEYKQIGMICGGTGITPMFQVVQAVLNNPDDRTKVSMLYANRSVDDILLKDRLDALASVHPDRFKITYTLDKAPKGWSGKTGFVTQEMVEQTLFKADADNVKCFVCGPPPMMRAICGDKDGRKQGELAGCLKTAGFAKEAVFKF